MKTATPTPPAAESALKTPRVTALVRELYRLKSNTLRYPCETALRQLAEELETEHAAAQQRIVDLEKELARLDQSAGHTVLTIANREADRIERLAAALKEIELRAKEALSRGVPLNAHETMKLARLALRHPERT